MSPRPGRIALDVPVTLPRPRTLASMAEPQFLADTQRIREVIYGARGFGTADRPTL